MAEKNPYFPHLFEPLKVGSKIVKNRIRRQLQHYFAHLIIISSWIRIRLVTPPRYRSVHSGCWKRRQKAVQESSVWVRSDPNHEYDKRFPFEPYLDYTSRSDKKFNIIKETAEMIKSYGALAIGELISCGEIKTNIGDGINPKGPSEKDLPDGTHVDAFTKEEILSCYQDYVTACKWFEAAGWEGVMIHCGHGLASGTVPFSAVQ